MLQKDKDVNMSRFLGGLDSRWEPTVVAETVMK
jgi:hypothetical protein